MEEICDRAARKYTAKKFGLGSNGGGLVRRPSPVRVDFMNAYAEHLRNIIKARIALPDHYEAPLTGFKVSFTYTRNMNQTDSSLSTDIFLLLFRG